MRKIILFMVLLVAVPAMAVSNVDITCTADGNEVTVSYATDANLIRAFGLDITVDTANIVDLVMVDLNYRIYPGQIVIVDGNVTDYNTPYVPGDLGDANVTGEMGSLYTMDPNYAGDPNLGYGMQPGTSGVLLKFYVDGDCNYAVTENEIRGGVVMEDPTEDPNLTLCSGSVTIVTVCVGDVDDNGFVNKADIIAMVGYLGNNASAPFWTVPSTNPAYMEAADVDGNGFVNKADIIALVGYLGNNASAPFWTVPCP
jgi:hypothetical protein